MNHEKPAIQPLTCPRSGGDTSTTQDHYTNHAGESRYKGTNRVGYEQAPLKEGSSRGAVGSKRSPYARRPLRKSRQQPSLHRENDNCDTACLIDLTRPTNPSASALVQPLALRQSRRYPCVTMVGQGRLELPTSCLSGTHSNHLSYWPRAANSSRVKSSARLFTASGNPKRHLRTLTPR